MSRCKLNALHRKTSCVFCAPWIRVFETKRMRREAFLLRGRQLFQALKMSARMWNLHNPRHPVRDVTTQGHSFRPIDVHLLFEM